MTRLRTGILGCGGIAQKHAEAALALPDKIELVAVCDRTEAGAQAFAAQYAPSAAAVSNYEQMLDSARLDLLLVCLPPYAHTDQVEKAAERGIHLLVEKPIALTSEHAWRRVAALEQAGVKTQVGFMYRFGAPMQQLKRHIETGAAGPVGLFSARYFCNSLHAPWWRDREKSGGQLVEQAIHLFDCMRYLLGEPTTVFSRQTNVFHQDTPGYTVEDVSATVCAFPGGGLGVIYATNGAVPGKWIKEWRVVSQRLLAEFTDWNHATFTHTTETTPTQEQVASEQNVFVLQLADLVDSILSGGETRTPMREGARSLDLVLAAARSAQTGAEIQFGPC